MLRRGAALPEISQVLRHRDLASMAVYAKVDLAALRGVARCWPEAQRLATCPGRQASTCACAAPSATSWMTPTVSCRASSPPGLNLTVGAWLLSELVGRGRAKDLVLTGRWVGAAKAFALGLVDCVCDDPHGAVGRIVADLDRRGTDAGIKTVIAAGGLLARP